MYTSWNKKIKFFQVLGHGDRFGTIKTGVGSTNYTTLVIDKLTVSDKLKLLFKRRKVFIIYDNHF